MAEYISYQMIPSVIGIEKGDVVLLTSDITDLFLQCQEHGERFDPNVLLDRFQEAIGEVGTLLVPTYNWGFCQGKTFDYRKTPSKTGAIGNAALRRKDFRRTKHPIYSFAVWGKDTEYLCALDNVESFGADSPFAYLEKVNGKNVFIGSASMPRRSGATMWTRTARSRRKPTPCTSGTSTSTSSARQTRWSMSSMPTKPARAD